MKRLISIILSALASSAAAKSVPPVKAVIAPQTRAERWAGDDSRAGSLDTGPPMESENWFGVLQSGDIEKVRTRMSEPTGMAQDSSLEKSWQTQGAE